MNKSLSIAISGILAATIATGCTTTQKSAVVAPKYLEQIVYRDLTKREESPVYSGTVDRFPPVERKAAPPLTSNQIQTKYSPQVVKLLKEIKDLPAPELALYREVVGKVSKPGHQIDFENESAELSDPEIVKDIIANLKDGQHVLLVGHSHGKSSVGIEKLSTKRANKIASELVKAGIGRERIHTMASWSPGGEAHAPVKGVQVFVSSGEDASKVYLQLARL